MTKEQEKALKLIEDSMNKKCNGLECKVVKNNIDLRLEIIQLNRQIDLMAEYMAEEFFEYQLDYIYQKVHNATSGMERDWNRGKEAEIKDIKQYFKEIAERKSEEWKKA